MTNFIDFKTVVQRQFSMMSNHELFKVEVDKDILWDTYLNSFPEGTNKLFRERTEHDCQCCKQFIRTCGNVVAIIDNKIVSIWDVEIGDQYEPVARSLSELVKSKQVVSTFLHNQSKLGTDFNHQLINGGDTRKWEHFYFELPNKFVERGDGIGSSLSITKSGKDVFKRALVEITTEAVETVLELIEQKSIYRGEENKSVVQLFLKHKNEFDALESDQEKDNYCWANSVVIGGAARVRNTSIGTLLVDVSDGVDLDVAVRSFESKVAPTNYKRPTAIITKSMIDNAQKKVVDLGIENALQRRFAVTEDITINNVLFADRTAKKAMGVFDELKKEASEKIPKLDKVDEVSIEDFINNVLPSADSIELMLGNNHTGNLVSLIAPTNIEANSILKWGNNFTWSYNGEVTDSIKDRVKKAGGSVTGDLRCSLSWFNADDLDIHIIEPNGNQIFFSSRENRFTGGKLDVDMNAGGRNNSVDPVENITWPNKDMMLQGDYRLVINNYAKRSNENVGFTVEVEFNGVINSFDYPKALRNKESVDVATFNYSEDDGLKIVKSIPSTQVSKEVWNIATQKFHKVNMVMQSPNHWDGEETGNKHYFFMLDNCLNPDKARGFYNEFLRGDLTEHRKVFEVLSSKMKTEKSDDQLSGLGFSSTQKNHVLCKVRGSFNRIIKIKF